MTPSIVALIPARAGSKRVPGKNTRLLGGVPLIVWTIRAAQQSGIFDEIHVCSDDPVARNQARVEGVLQDVRDPSADDEPDIDWIRRMVIEADAFAILRPTSPFRTAETIQKAWKCFTLWSCDSIRAVRPTRENPYKMWWYDPLGGTIEPMFPRYDEHGTSFHSLPSQRIGPLLIQTGGLEMAWTRVLRETTPTISGRRICPFQLKGYEGLDINTEDDWHEAERIVAEGLVQLPAPATLAASAPPR